MSTISADIDALRRRIIDLQDRLDRIPEKQASELTKAIEELHIAVVELLVAEEELRMQNERLAQMQDALRQEQRRYQELFDFAPDAYLSTTLDGAIQEANHAAAGLLGVRHDFLVGKPLTVFIPEHEKAAFLDRLSSLREQRVDLLRNWKLMFLSREGRLFPSSVNISIVRRGDRPAELRWAVRELHEHA